MPRSSGNAVENNFAKGLITEATGMTFPENAVSDAENCRFDQTGYVTRRLGIDVEVDYTSIAYIDGAGVTIPYIWRAVSLTGNNTFLVLQRGVNISFFVMNSSGNLSAGLRTEFIDLEDFHAPGAGALQYAPCQFASGLGRMFVTNPRTDPVLVTYDDIADTLTFTRVEVKSRDWKGVEDSLAPDEEPSTLTAEHFYNLKNQGWYEDVRVGSSTASDSGG